MGVYTPQLILRKQRRSRFNLRKLWHTLTGRKSTSASSSVTDGNEQKAGHGVSAREEPEAVGLSKEERRRLFAMDPRADYGQVRATIITALSYVCSNTIQYAVTPNTEESPQKIDPVKLGQAPADGRQSQAGTAHGVVKSSDEV
jgi:hypothetical protein